MYLFVNLRQEGKLLLQALNAILQVNAVDSFVLQLLLGRSIALRQSIKFLLQFLY